MNSRGQAYKQVAEAAKQSEKKRIANSMAHLAKCEGCGRRGAGTRKRYRLNPKNLRQEWGDGLRCQKCAEGWFVESGWV